MRQPSAGPGPRKELTEVRFALSNDALKTNGVFVRVVISFNARAISQANASVSSAQGPRMKKADRDQPGCYETRMDEERERVTLLVFLIECADIFQSSLEEFFLVAGEIVDGLGFEHFEAIEHRLSGA